MAVEEMWPSSAAFGATTTAKKKKIKDKRKANFRFPDRL